MSILRKIAVVIPIYQESLSEYETISLRQSEYVFDGFSRIAIKPERLTLPVAASPDLFERIISFDDSFFTGIAGYNKLMLSSGFYEQFLGFEFILIYQLDAFVFKNELSYWCDQNFDYIGAPWIRKYSSPNLLKSFILNVQRNLSTKFNLKKNNVPNKYQFEGKVGNGGLSLRRVKKFHELTLTMKSAIDFYLAQQPYQYNEDAFWSIEVNRKKNQLVIPSWETGLRFAFETYPDRAYQLNNNKLPFGCHDWDSYIDFWRPIFKQHGYEI